VGESTEVIDDEAHAVYEALNYVRRTDATQKRLIVCIDNLAAPSLLENNTSRLEYIHAAQLKARHLHAQGVHVGTRRIPAHININGNDQADKLAKKGAGNADHRCADSRTTVTHLRRANRARFFRSWSSATGEQITSWNYPDHFAKWTLVESLTFFKFFCRRTNFDHY
jgi:hypothetical protein